jgi:hypothetical protein
VSAAELQRESGAALTVADGGNACHGTVPALDMSLLLLGLSGARDGRTNHSENETEYGIYLRASPVNVGTLHDLKPFVGGVQVRFMRPALLLALLGDAPQHHLVGAMELSVGAGDAVPLLAAGGGFPALRRLRCDGAEAHALIDAVRATLRTLNLRTTSFAPHETTAVIAAVARCQKLRRLTCDYASLSAAAVAALAAVLRGSVSLRALDLCGCYADDAAAAALGDALAVNATLRHLDLRENLVRSAGAAALGRRLPRAAALRSINLSGNDVGDDGAAAMAEGGAESPALRSLSLAGCGIGLRGMAALAGLVAASATLRVLIASSNPRGGGAGVMARFAAAIAVTVAPLEALDIALCRFDGAPADMEALGRGVARSATLATLTIGEPHWRTAEASLRAFARAAALDCGTPAALRTINFVGAEASLRQCVAALTETLSAVTVIEWTV